MVETRGSVDANHRSTWYWYVTLFRDYLYSHREQVHHRAHGFAVIDDHRFVRLLMTRRHAGRARRRVASHRARNGGPRDGVQGVRARGAVGNRRWRAFRGARRVSRAALARVSDGRRRDRARLVERTDGDFGCSRGRDDAGAVVLARVRRLGWSRARASRRRAFSSGRRARGSPRAPRGGALARARQPVSYTNIRAHETNVRFSFCVLCL